MKDRVHPVVMNGPGTVNMKVMRMDVDIMYEAKMGHNSVNVSANNNLEPGMLLGGTYEDENGTGYSLWLDI